MVLYQFNGTSWIHTNLRFLKGKIFVPTGTDEYVSRLEKKALERLRAELKKYSI
jgi:hypothetical protein